MPRSTGPKGNQFSQLSIFSPGVRIRNAKSTDAIERLLEEYASLARRQYEALQKSSYAQMSRVQAAAYDIRFRRIQEISKEVITLRSEDSQIHLETEKIGNKSSPS